MNTLLLILSGVFAVLLIWSIGKARSEATARRQLEAERHTPEVQAQHERSLRRRAQVRSTHADRMRRGDTHEAGSPPGTGSGV